MLAVSNVQNQQKHRPFIIPIFLPHAGCPHQCVFCNQVAISGTKHEVVDPEKIRYQIREFLKFRKKNRKPAEVAFFGGNFLGLQPEEIKSWLALADDFVRRGLVDGIRFSTRPDTIDAARLDILDKYSVSTVELGVQSMDDRVLALAERGHSASDTIRAVEALRERQLDIGLQIMVGLPGDNEAVSLITAKKIAALRPDFVRIYPTIVIKNSPLARWYQNGTYAPLSLEEAVTRVKNLYQFISRYNIKIIRMGLQASEDFEDGQTVLAGPYHPAFGHLVLSDIFYDKALAAIESAGFTTGRLSIWVNPRSISKLRGLNNSNINKLKARFELDSVEVMPDSSLAEEELWINSVSSYNF